MKLKSYLPLALASLIVTGSISAEEYYVTLSEKSLVVKSVDGGNSNPTPSNNVTDFSGAFDPANWSRSGVASISHTSSALTASVSSGGGGVNATVTIPFNGVISFDWLINVYSAGQYGDSISYAVNGSQVTLSGAGNANGTASNIAVSAGDTFRLSTWGSSASSSYNASFSNFTFTEQ